jgi:hypothetical protein
VLHALGCRAAADSAAGPHARGDEVALRGRAERWLADLDALIARHAQDAPPAPRGRGSGRCFRRPARAVTPARELGLLGTPAGHG